MSARIFRQCLDPLPCRRIACDGARPARLSPVWRGVRSLAVVNISSTQAVEATLRRAEHG